MTKIITNEKTKNRIKLYSLLSVAIIVIAAVLGIAAIGTMAHVLIHSCSSTAEAFLWGAMLFLWVIMITGAVHELYKIFQEKFMSHLVNYYEKCLREKAMKAYQDAEKGIKSDFIKE